MKLSFFLRNFIFLTFNLFVNLEYLIQIHLVFYFFFLITCRSTLFLQITIVMTISFIWDSVHFIKYQNRLNFTNDYKSLAIKILSVNIGTHVNLIHHPLTDFNEFSGKHSSYISLGYHLVMSQLIWIAHPFRSIYNDRELITRYIKNYRMIRYEHRMIMKIDFY